MNACPMIASCAARQDPGIALEWKTVLEIVEPNWVLLWDAYVPRVQSVNEQRAVDGPTHTWAMVLK